MSETLQPVPEQITSPKVEALKTIAEHERTPKLIGNGLLKIADVNLKYLNSPTRLGMINAGERMKARSKEWERKASEDLVKENERHRELFGGK